MTTTARNLYAVPPPTPEPWDRQEGETEDEYSLFWLWWSQGAPPLVGDALELARLRDWTPRANALSAQLESRERDPLEQVGADALWIICEGMKRIKRDFRRNPDYTPQPRFLLDVGRVLQLIDTAAQYTRASSLPVAELPESVLRELERAAELADRYRAAN